jgi:TolB-like protein
MLSVETDAEAARQELERILRSAGFVHSERLSRFLRFVVERHLEGKGHELKESVIAVEVFGRPPDYNPRQDAVVRVEAGRLRARLSEFYVGEGKNDPLVIELLKGGYTPVFRHYEVHKQTTQQVTRTGSRRWILGALSGLGVVLGVMGWWRVQLTNKPVTIAVLPLENLSRDPANDYFVDGLTDEIIRNLSIIEGLEVRSQTSSFALKGKPRNVHETGQQLNVDYLLEGSVLRVDERLRIDAQLIRVRDDVPLWSNRFDRDLNDVFAIQDEISSGIVNNLRLKLGAGRRRYETSVEAARNPQRRGFLGFAYARSGRREEAEKMASASIYANEQALIYAGLGDKDRTFEALDRMAELGAQRVGVYINYPELAFLRDDPRLKALQKKIGLPVE